MGSASVIARAAAVAAIFIVNSSSLAAGKISIMVSGLDKLIYLPFKLAENLGYFKDEGLEVELLSTHSGISAENELLAGAVQGVGGFYDHCLELQAKGKFVVSIVQINRTPGEIVLANSKHPEVNSPRDFRGISFGVTGLGSSTNFLAKYIALQSAVSPREFSIIPVGAGATFRDAIQQDKIQAGMTTEPTASQLIESGQAKGLLDLTSPETTRAVFGGLYPGAALYVQLSWIETHRDQAQKLANALVRTLRFIQANSAAAIADKMPVSYYSGDKEDYVRALAASRQMFTPDGVMPEHGPETVYAVMLDVAKHIQNTKINLSQTYTTEFVKKAARITENTPEVAKEKTP
jgi:NitT/TauT family transport system substrate-binding protein